MSFKDAIAKFTDEVKDLSSLQVTTYTGSLEEAIGEGGEINWEAFKPTSGKLVLAAATLVKADYDTVNFRSGDKSLENIGDLLELHQSAVESAQNGRLAMVKMFG
ncbi:MAG: hypothetical protein KC420_13035, partial [Myxococcales bacterium]|nr:hypothetical protein [Myxococcales bacterium]